MLIWVSFLWLVMLFGQSCIPAASPSSHYYARRKYWLSYSSLMAWFKFLIQMHVCFLMANSWNLLSINIKVHLHDIGRQYRVMRGVLRPYFAIFREKSAVSHCITWRHPLTVKQVHIDGATAFAASGMWYFLLIQIHLQLPEFWSLSFY